MFKSRTLLLQFLQFATLWTYVMFPVNNWTSLLVVSCFYTGCHGYALGVFAWTSISGILFRFKHSNRRAGNQQDGIIAQPSSTPTFSFEMSYWLLFFPRETCLTNCSAAAPSQIYFSAVRETNTASVGPVQDVAL